MIPCFVRTPRCPLGRLWSLLMGTPGGAAPLFPCRCDVSLVSAAFPLLPPVALVHSRSFHCPSLRYVTVAAVDSLACKVCEPP